MRGTWGLTGGIASGKSQVAEILRKRGIPVIDADEVARDLRAPGRPAHLAIEKAFGTTDPTELRERLKSPTDKKKLESILHPLIVQESQRLLAEARKTSELVFYEAALLVETGRYQDFDGLWVVTAPEEVRIQRIMDRDGVTKEAAQSMIQAQTSDEERLKVATHEIPNQSTLDDLEQHIASLI